MNDLRDFSDEDLKKELEWREKKNNKPPLQKDDIDWTPLLVMVQEGVDGIARDGRPGKDFDHYVFETVMECVYDRDIWKWWNSHANY